MPDLPAAAEPTRKTCLAVLPFAALACTAGLVLAQASESEEPRGRRLKTMQQEIRRLRGEVSSLAGRERGILGELERLSAGMRLYEAELGEISLRLQDTVSAVEELTARLGELEREQGGRRRYLEFRLREIYKRGPADLLRRLVGGSEVEQYLRGLSYAFWLSKRDAESLEEYRRKSEELEEKSESLAAERERLAGLKQEADGKRRALARRRSQRAEVLAGIRQDRERRQAALNELQAASSELTGLIDDLGSQSPALDVRKFRGLLDPPAAGEVSAGFGNVIHPRFRTKVPHPGLDIEAPAGTDFVSIFDGTVMFASWLRGYGLTAIVDHGEGVLSVYAHASVLLVGKNERVDRGQVLGKVGETGSLRGPYLYFEIRDNGKPIDPAVWIRSR